MSKKPVGIGAFIKAEPDGTFTVTIAFHHIETREKGELLAAWLAGVVVPRLGEIGMSVVDLGKAN